MLERMLIPLDGSTTAETILTQARRLLKLRDSEVILLRVVDYMKTQQQEALLYLEGVHRALTEAGVRARAIVRESPVAPAILAAAEEQKATLIAMSTHGRSGIPRFVFGSVAERILRASPAPVLVVRALSAAAHKEHPFRHILFPTDGSDFSKAAIQNVLELAVPLDARVTLLHVIDPNHPAPPWSLQPAANVFAQAGIAAATETRRGDAATEILNATIDLKADLLVMPTHGRSGVSRWVLGSVTEKVIREAGAPVLVIRRPKGAP